MVITRHSRSGDGCPKRPGLTDKEIREMITTQVTMVVGEGNPHDFGSIKTVIIERFDEQYIIVIVDATVAATATVSSMGGSGEKVILVPGL